MFCTNCGKQLPDNAKFCTGCGTPQKAPSQPSAATSTISHKQKSKPILPVILSVLALVLLAGAGVLLYTMFGSQTTYLLTEQESKNQAAGSINNTCTSYEYDEQGRLLSYKTENEFGADTDSTTCYTAEWTYEYDDDGKLISVEMESQGQTMEFEYIYKDGVLKEIKADDLQIKVKCDDAGNIIKLTASLGDMEYCQGNYSYYPNGVLKEAELSTEHVSHYYRFNEAGKILEQETETSYYRFVVTNEYDDNGNLILSETRQYSEGELVVEQITHSGYNEDGMLCEHEIESTNYGFSEDITFDARIKGNTVTLTPESNDTENFTYEITYDDQGNILESLTESENLTNRVTYEYEEFKLPRSYVKPNIQNPLYLIFLS